MKNKKILIAVVATIIVIVSIVCGIKFIGKKSSKTPNLSLGEILNIQESELGDEDFSIYVTGAYWGSLNKDELQKLGLKIYEFEMGVLEDEDNVTNTYKGFNLAEWLTKSQIDDFQTITFMSIGDDASSFSLDIEQIRDTMYIVLYKNGEFMNDDYRSSLVGFDGEKQVSFDNIATITFAQVEEESNDDVPTNEDSSQENE